MGYAIAITRAWLGTGAAMAVKYNVRMSSRWRAPELISRFDTGRQSYRDGQPCVSSSGPEPPQLISRPVGFKRLDPLSRMHIRRSRVLVIGRHTIAEDRGLSVFEVRGDDTELEDEGMVAVPSVAHGYSLGGWDVT